MILVIGTIFWLNLLKMGVLMCRQEQRWISNKIIGANILHTVKEIYVQVCISDTNIPDTWKEFIKLESQVLLNLLILIECAKWQVCQTKLISDLANITFIRSGQKSSEKISQFTGVFVEIFKAVMGRNDSQDSNGR